MYSLAQGTWHTEKLGDFCVHTVCRDKSATVSKVVLCAHFVQGKGAPVPKTSAPYLSFVDRIVEKEWIKDLRNIDEEEMAEKGEVL